MGRQDVLGTAEGEAETVVVADMLGTAEGGVDTAVAADKFGTAKDASRGSHRAAVVSAQQTLAWR